MLEVIIEVISLTGFPQSCQKHFAGRLRTATYEVTISVNGKEYLKCIFPEKEVKQGNAGADENLGKKFGCKISKESTVTIEVECKHGTMHDPHEVSIAELEIGSVKFNDETPITLNYSAKNEQMSGTLALKVTRVATSAELVQFKIPSHPTQCLYTVADLEGLGVVSQILKSKLGLECPEWVNLLGSMGTLLKVAEPVAEVDPHAKSALIAAQIAFELFMKQKERDERVLGLVQVMANVYQMILDSDPLIKCRTLSQSVNELVALTRECAYFITQYIKSGSFGQRMVLSTLSNADELISQFEKQFFLIKEVFFAGIMLSIGQVTVRILDKLETMDETLTELHDRISFPVIGRSWTSFEACLNATEENILSEIVTWGSSCNDKNPNIFLLLDTLSAKTTISYHVAKYFHGIGRLGATIFFDAENSSCRNLILSVIRDLTIYDPAFRQIFMAGLKEHPRFSNDHPNDQLRFLDRKVFKNLKIIGPVAIVIDALEMCKDREIWGLLEILSRFPSQFRFLITSKRKEDIILDISAKCSVLRKTTMITEDDLRWGSLELYICKHFAMLESSHQHLFVTYSYQKIAKEIYVKSNKVFNLARLILEFISIAHDQIAVKLLKHIVASEYPFSSVDANECSETKFMKALEIVGVSAETIIQGKWKRSPDNALTQLAESQYIQVIDGEISTGIYTTDVELKINLNLFSQCSTENCNATRALQLVSALLGIRRNTKFFKDCTSSALHCILSCKCTYPSQAIKAENQSLLELLRIHQVDCIHKTPSSELSVLGAIQRHHVILQNFETRDYFVPVYSKSDLVALTPLLEHSGLSASANKITLVKIYLSVYTLGDVHVEAAIYRALTEKGKDTLAQFQIKLKQPFARGIEPFIESTDADDVEVVKNPLDENSSWFVKNMPKSSSFEAIWFNCPIPTSNQVKQDFSEDEATGGHGIGFVNLLLPGDRIAILAKSNEWFDITTQVTLFTNSKEKCPPSK